MWTRPVNAPEQSAAVRRSAFFAERGLTGRDPRPYPPAASEWLGYSHCEACGERAYGPLLLNCLGKLARLLHALHETTTDLALLLGSKM